MLLLLLLFFFFLLSKVLLSWEWASRGMLLLGNYYPRKRKVGAGLVDLKTVLAGKRVGAPLRSQF